jgi:hypothetical protein
VFLARRQCRGRVETLDRIGESLQFTDQGGWHQSAATQGDHSFDRQRDDQDGHHPDRDHEVAASGDEGQQIDPEGLVFGLLCRRRGSLGGEQVADGVAIDRDVADRWRLRRIGFGLRAGFLRGERRSGGETHHQTDEEQASEPFGERRVTGRDRCNRPFW